MDVVKRPIRQALEAQRAAQDPALLMYRDQSLIAALLATPQWQSAPAIAAFLGGPGEPDTTALLDAAWASGKTMWLPRLYGNVLRFVATTSRAQLVATTGGRLEPAISGSSPPRMLAEIVPPMMLVPGLGFSRSGARLGTGRGDYDRTLAPVLARTDIWRVGVCHATFLDPPLFPIPMAAHDVPMHAVATEYGVVACTPGQ